MASLIAGTGARAGPRGRVIELLCLARPHQEWLSGSQIDHLCSLPSSRNITPVALLARLSPTPISSPASRPPPARAK